MENFEKAKFRTEFYEMSKAKLNRLKKLVVIGEGTYGVVFKALNKLNGETIAVKHIKEIAFEECARVTTLREISVLKTHKHHNIIQLKDVLCTGPLWFYLVFEHFEQNLKNYLTRITCKPQEMLIRSYTKQLMDALAFTHSSNIVHRDLKPGNILIDREGNLKLSDFSQSVTLTKPVENYKFKTTTLWYKAPEILFGCKICGPKEDMWSAGCVLAELIDFDILFQGYSDMDQIKRIFNVLGTPDPKSIMSQLITNEARMFNENSKAKGLDYYISFHSKEQQQFLENLIVYNPDLRMSAIECLRNDYLQNVEKVKPLEACFNNANVTSNESAEVS